MPIVKVDLIPLPVQHTAKISVSYSDKEGACCSQISWNTAEPSFRQMFGIKEYEELTHIEVTEAGIKASIRSIPVTSGDTTT